MKKTIKTLDELRFVAQAFLEKLTREVPQKQAVLVGLTGDLGSGKTAFTKCVASLLGIPDTVTSPTFVLEKRYSIPEGSILNKRFSRLIHIDAYRLHKGEEMNALDWKATLADSGNLILLEWPEQVEDALPKNTITFSFEYIDDGIRSVAGEFVE